MRTLVIAALFAVSGIATAQSPSRVDVYVSSDAGQPLSYSTIVVSPGAARFSNEEGHFFFNAKPGTAYRIKVRHLGFSAVDTTVIAAAGAPLTVRLSLAPVALHLSVVKVKERNDCRIDDRSSELAVLLEELIKNAERDKLLRTEYPFAYKLERTLDVYDPQLHMTSKRHDVGTYGSLVADRYAPGRVVRDTKGKRVRSKREVHVPSLGDIADDAFLRNHCFVYAGITNLGNSTVHKIEFEPTISLRNSIDLSGTAYLDTATYMIRQADYVLTNGVLATPPVEGYEISTTFTEIYPGLAIFSRIRSEQRMSGAGFSYTGGKLVDDQRLMGVIFSRGQPGRQ